MTMVNNWTSGHGLLVGKYHEVLTGRVSKTYATPDGDAAPWKDAPVGSIHMYEGTGGGALYVKVKDDNLDNDWAIASGFVAQRDVLADFTDGGAAVGTLTLDGTIPAGATVTHTVVRDVTGFAGDTSAVLAVGDGTDADRYIKNSATLNVFGSTSGPILHADTVMDGIKYHVAAKQPVLTITSASDWGAVTAGALTVIIFYQL